MLLTLVPGYQIDLIIEEEGKKKSLNIIPELQIHLINAVVVHSALCTTRWSVFI